MVNVTLLWLLLIPAILSLISLFLLPRITAASRTPFTFRESGVFAIIGLLISVMIMSSWFYLSIGSKTADVEVWNGHVLSKTRQHGHYVRSYSCNCRQSCSGSGNNRSCTTICDTCYEDRYTVHWYCDTTIGRYTIQYFDRTSKRVYSEPNPPRWDIIKVDDPVSDARSYTNYVKAVPESLFRPAAKELKAKFASAIPPYPANVYDFYHVDRVIPVGVSVPNLKEWNAKLQDTLKYLGPTKQVNAVIVLVNTNDPNYEYALQDAWAGAKKNDVVLIIGTTAYPKVEWVRVLSWTDRELFKVKLRDEVLALEQLSPDAVMTKLASAIRSDFQRKRMREFEYLKGEIDPPTWALVGMVLMTVIVYLGFWGFCWYRPQNGNFNRRPTTWSSRWAGPR